MTREFHFQLPEDDKYCTVEGVYEPTRIHAEGKQYTIPSSRIPTPWMLAIPGSSIKRRIYCYFTNGRAKCYFIYKRQRISVYSAMKISLGDYATRCRTYFRRAVVFS